MSEANKAMIEFWNGRAGEKWSAMQTDMDRMMAPVTAALKARVGSVAGQRVLDIGCGTGETCVIWLEGGAQVTGVDVSAPMLALAAKRTGGRAKLIEADASVWKGDAPFDLAVSRFGVMFFADPGVAFAAIAANVRPGGRLVFACWRPMAENPWAREPLAAVRALLPEAPTPVPNAPGPFGLADGDRTRSIVERAGFSNVTLDKLDVPMCYATEGGVDAAVPFAMQFGPTAAALAEASQATRDAAADRLKAVFAPHDQGGKVALGGAIWLVEAVRSA